jgi:hypothetical protein
MDDIGNIFNPDVIPPDKKMVEDDGDWSDLEGEGEGGEEGEGDGVDENSGEHEHEHETAN